MAITTITNEESKRITFDVTLHGDRTASIKYGPNLEQKIASTTQYDYRFEKNVGINNMPNFPMVYIPAEHIHPGQNEALSLL